MLLNLLIILFIWAVGVVPKHKFQRHMFQMPLYLDQNSLIVQRDMDGGDTAGREGDYYFYTGVTNGLQIRNFPYVVQKLQVSPGVFVRNPRHNSVVFPSKSWDDHKDFSRDQTVSLILALGAMGDHKTLFNLLFKHVCRFGAYQNFSVRWSKSVPNGDADYKHVLGSLWVKGDFLNLEDIGAYIRSLNMWYLYPALWLTDVSMLVESIIRLYASKSDVSDDINHTLLLLQAQYKYQTPLSCAARKLYKRRGVQDAWDRYFNPASGANPFNDLYRDLISRM